jgi:hypothetical protein
MAAQGTGDRQMILPANQASLHSYSCGRTRRKRRSEWSEESASTMDQRKKQIHRAELAPWCGHPQAKTVFGDDSLRFFSRAVELKRSTSFFLA